MVPRFDVVIAAVASVYQGSMGWLRRRILILVTFLARANALRASRFVGSVQWKRVLVARAVSLCVSIRLFVAHPRYLSLIAVSLSVDAIHRGSLG